jgi:ornithine cyclodeaminase/alanine dehydrogenase-like protein (mu-crystallin family)
MLVRQVGELVLVARTRARLERLAERLRASSPGPVAITSDVREAVGSADIVITVSSAIDVLVEPEDLRSPLWATACSGLWVAHLRHVYIATRGATAAD